MRKIQYKVCDIKIPKLLLDDEAEPFILLSEKIKKIYVEILFLKETNQSSNILQLSKYNFV